jgi:excisionase family DNA binding protein
MPVASTTWLTPPEVAAELRSKASTVIRWVVTGELRAANLARSLAGRPRYRIARADLDAFLAARQAAAVAAPSPVRRRTRKPATPAGYVAYIMGSTGSATASRSSRRAGR